MIHRLKHWAHRHRHPERYALLRDLLATQSLSRAQLLAKQQQDLAAIVAHAVAHVPYYREKYRHLSRSSWPVHALAGLPPLRKDEVIEHKDALLADDADRSAIRIGHTGGSTGKPVAFYYDQHKTELMRAGMCRSYMGSGWRPGEKILNFWGARQDIKERTFTKRLDEYVAAERTIGAYEYTQADLTQWVTAINRYRPVLLQGYASILAELARHVLDRKLRLPATLKGVYSTAEVLHGWQRELMASAFGCRVFNQYGSREVPNIAVECRHGNMHVHTDMVYLESVQEDGEDKLLITSLTNRLMPFIRYDIGDSGRLMAGDCPCGSPSPLLEMGVCRSNDLIRTRHGKVVYPSYFIHLLDGLAGVQQYQFVQTAFDSMTLHLLTTHPLSADAAASLQARIQARIHQDVDADMALEIRYVEAIPRTRSGKHRFVIREMA